MSEASKTVWITGASSGIGEALAQLYARDGHTAVISARRLENLTMLAAAVETSGASGKLIPVSCDVTSDESVRDAVTQLIDLAGVPDVIVLNAGFYEPCELSEATMEHFNTTLNVNFHGVVRCFLEILPHLQDKQSTSKPHLVIVSSVAGYSGLPRAAAYGSSKATLTHLAESIRPECKAIGIDVTVVNPGFVKTPLTDLNEFPMPFIIDVDTAAEAMYKGLATRRFEVTFPKRFTWIMKFLRILPYPLYFAIAGRLV